MHALIRNEQTGLYSMERKAEAVENMDKITKEELMKKLGIEALDDEKLEKAVGGGREYRKCDDTTEDDTECAHLN